MIDANGFGLIHDIDVRLTVELGRAQMRLRDVLDLAEDSVVMLDRLIDEPLDVMVNGKLIAKGEVIAEGNRFGLRILELAGNGRGDATHDRRAPPIEVRATGSTADKGGKAGKVA
jgi:flagellar motor switch protein FliN/FliY